jgi:transcriptional antiterminator RfaH
MLRWYLIHTKPASESVAQAHLQRQGYEVYFPRLLQPTRRRARWTDALVALFPRYLFLRLSEGEQPLSPVRSTAGVSCVVRFGTHYAVVPDHVVGELRARANPQTGLHRLSDHLPFAPGRAVRVAGHVLDGLEGVFEREAGAERVVVLLKLLGQDVPVRVPADLIVPMFAI